MKSTRQIMIIDDEPDIRDVMVDAFSALGYNAVAAPNGREALAVLKDMAKPAVILLDLMMPQMDGFEFLQYREKVSDLNDVPIVVISADGQADSKLEGLDITAYIKKPIDLDELNEVAERYCG